MTGTKFQNENQQNRSHLFVSLHSLIFIDYLDPIDQIIFHNDKISLTVHTLIVIFLPIMYNQHTRVHIT